VCFKAIFIGVFSSKLLFLLTELSWAESSKSDARCDGRPTVERGQGRQGRAGGRTAAEKSARDVNGQRRPERPVEKAGPSRRALPWQQVEGQRSLTKNLFKIKYFKRLLKNTFNNKNDCFLNFLFQIALFIFFNGWQRFEGKMFLFMLCVPACLFCLSRSSPSSPGIKFQSIPHAKDNFRTR